ncbi:hypothetical protein [Novosphingobium arvoryzae]|uniref:Uncharacterized protein n=1 Tax=Novosphingobium arvoryzae TaxID=1256514 RepID=A0A918VC41_9SPHN|nr:hypothetical protein [Novosphingobium arvoryzae]GGZ90230.1 hypothetical protein GCM10011617_06410 [Novosphingobium arvoryzae]
MTWLTAKNSAAWVDWITEHDWNVFGTIKFAPNRNHVHPDQARRSWSKFWNKCDRLTYGQTGNRIERAVFEHYGANGDDAHSHFLAKLPVDPKFGCVAMNALWRSMFTHAAPPSMNEITPIICTGAAANYGLREEWKLDSDTLNLKLSHLSQPGTLASLEARQRLLAAAQPHWLADAHKSLPKHIAAAEERYKRRHG